MFKKNLSVFLSMYKNRILKHSRFWLSLFLFASFYSIHAQENLIVNTFGRETISLNGTWHYIIDPYGTGFYDYRYKEKSEDDKSAYWNVPETKKSSLVEYGYNDTYSIKVPGDWNSQDKIFQYYEGIVWYQRDFDIADLKNNKNYFIYFGAVNYVADVYINGKKIGSHKGGFTPFNFEVPKELLKEKNNFLVVKVDNTRHHDEIPTVNTDWWNYGGITRDVKLVVTPDVFIEQYGLHLDHDQDILLAKKNNKFKISGIIKLNKTVSQSKINLEIPELKITKEYSIDGDSLSFNLTSKKLKLWSPENPKLYNISLSYNGEKITDKIGFRKIETSGKTILLNGKPLFLKGICLHEEIAEDIRRAYSKKDAEHLFRWVKDLNANMVRLAHYPHNEYMTRLADSLGILVWSEIPVYWTIQFENKTVLDKANNQLKEMIYRDQNRASVIIWSVGNETPVNETRTEFMSTLAIKAKKLDNTRLISAALQVQHTKGDVYLVDDPLGEYVDIVSINEYIGWYDGLPEKANTTSWEIKYNKPLFFSETGAGAKGGFHADKETRWSEEFQEWYYKSQIEMFKNNMPENYSGLSPWILVDFRSPRRNNPETQEGWNRKGLIDNNGVKKKAFYILKAYYDSIKN